MFDEKTKKKIEELNEKYLKTNYKNVKPDESDIQFLIDLAKNLAKSFEDNGEDVNYWDDEDKAQVEKK